jgi:plastocyanin
MNRILLFILLFSIGLSGLSGCNQEQLSPNIDPSGSACTTTSAQIGVGDGFIENLCGCTGAGELGKGVQPAPANVTCTVPSGTTVFFVYMGIETQHQIINNSGSSFPAGQIATPSDPNTHIAAALFSASGTYNFEDAFDTQIQGKIVVP